MYSQTEFLLNIVTLKIQAKVIHHQHHASANDLYTAGGPFNYTFGDDFSSTMNPFAGAPRSLGLASVRS